MKGEDDEDVDILSNDPKDEEEDIPAIKVTTAEIGESEANQEENVKVKKAADDEEEINKKLDTDVVLPGSESNIDKNKGEKKQRKSKSSKKKAKKAKSETKSTYLTKFNKLLNN